MDPAAGLFGVSDPEIVYRRRVRECRHPKCRVMFATVELDERHLRELLNLRETVRRANLARAAYSEQADAAADALEQLRGVLLLDED
jgi:hypothetical protein